MSFDTKGVLDFQLDNIIDTFNENGYAIIKNLYERKDIDLINSIINKLEPKSIIPFSKNVAWGYGNLLNNNDILKALSYNYLSKSLKPFLSSGKVCCNHILVVDKAPFIGPEVEWHQEFFNISTFAPGYSPKNDLNCFLQVFTALDEHTSLNGPLLVFKGSHREGLLPSEDIINSNLSHKRRIDFTTLEKLSKKYKIEEVLLKPGDTIIFNHLLVHGSQNNCSPNRRRAILLQYRVERYKKDMELYNQEIKHRTSFVIKNINSLTVVRSPAVGFG